MNYLGILLISAALAAAELPELFRRRQRKEAATVAVILLLGTTYALALAAKLPLPTASEVMQSVARLLTGTGS